MLPAREGAGNPSARLFPVLVPVKVKVKASDTTPSIVARVGEETVWDSEVTVNEEITPAGRQPSRRSVKDSQW